MLQRERKNEKNGKAHDPRRPESGGPDCRCWVARGAVVGWHVMVRGRCWSVLDGLVLVLAACLFVDARDSESASEFGVDLLKGDALDAEQAGGVVDEVGGL